MYCNVCGSEISENTKFCRKCGAEVKPENDFIPEEKLEIVKGIYKKDKGQLTFTYNDKIFDTSVIKELSVEQWAYPMMYKGSKWNGLYEELSRFVGEKEFALQFDSDEESYNTVKEAMSEYPVKLVGMSNSVIIKYSENPFTTDITVNGRKFNAELIQNRCIDEWIAPFSIRNIKWDGIFEELAKVIGVDTYTINFEGDRSFMNMLIDNCPVGVNVFYHTQKNDETDGVQKKSRQINNSVSSGTNANNKSNNNVSNGGNRSGAENINGNGNQSYNNAENQSTSQGFVKPNMESVKRATHALKESMTSAETVENVDNIPIKNAFIRNNIMTIIAAVSIVLLFLPFVSFYAKDSGVTSEFLSASGMETIFGIKKIKIGTNTSIFAIFLLVVPIIMIVMNYIKQLNPYKKIIAVVMPVVGIIMEIITLLDIKSLIDSYVEQAQMDSSMIHMSIGIGFILIIVLYVLMAVCGLMIYHNFKLPKRK